MYPQFEKVTKRYYCEVKGIEKELTSGLKIVFDFGNNPVYSAWGGLKSKQKLVDEKGEEIKKDVGCCTSAYPDSEALVKPKLQG